MSITDAEVSQGSKTLADRFAAHLETVTSPSHAYIGQLETGLRSPGLETLARLARALELDAADLVRGLQKLKRRS